MLSFIIHFPHTYSHACQYVHKHWISELFFYNKFPLNSRFTSVVPRLSVCISGFHCSSAGLKIFFYSLLQLRNNFCRTLNCCF